MDVQLRNLERTFATEQSSEALFHLLSAYPRSAPIPEIDLRILTLLHEGQTFKPRGPRDHHQGIGHIDPIQLKALYGMGYQAGIYFVTKNPSENTRLVVDTLLAVLKEANRRTVDFIRNLDSIDDIDVGPGNSYARARLPDGSVRHLVNAAQMVRALSISETEWLDISNTLSAYYSQITRGKKKETYGRFFIPAWVLDCCYALHTNQYTQGMSRSTRRSRSNTVIDWQRSPSKVADFRRRLYDDVMGEEVLGELPKDFGLNYFLAIDTTNVRPTPRTRQQRNPKDLPLAEMQESSCDCEVCRSMCLRYPCWPTPQEADHLINAGYGERLDLEHYQEYDAKTDRFLPAVWVVCPKLRGTELHPKGCTFQNEGLCELHGKHKPLEGRLAHHSGTPANLHQEMKSLWDTSVGRRVVEKFRKMGY
jgi:hypothetical protein